MLNTQVAILAGGYATRLRPLSLERPKALCPVCNVPLLGRLLRQLESVGIKRAVITLPFIDKEMKKLALAATPPGFHLNISIPRGSFRGTVPRVLGLLKPGTSSVMVIYGDSLLSLDLGEFMRFHYLVRQKGGLATILYHRPADLRFAEKDGRTYHGVMSVNRMGRVTKFVEKPKVEEIKPSFELANAAVFICERDLLEHPSLKGARDFSYDIFEQAVNKSLAPIYACSIGDGFRHDVGSLGRFYDANVKVLRRELCAYIPGKEEQLGFWMGEGTDANSAVITPPVLLGDGVYIGQNVELGPDVIIGDGSRIGDGAVIRRTVMMDDCRLGDHAETDRCVLGSHCRVSSGVKLPPYTVLGHYGIGGAEDWPNWAEEER